MHSRAVLLTMMKVQRERIEASGDRTPVASVSDHRDIPNGVTTSFTPVGNSADSRRFAQCCSTVYGTRLTAKLSGGDHCVRSSSWLDPQIVCSILKPAG